ELLARRRLRRYLAEEPGIAGIIECASAPAARAVLDQERPDLVFIDPDLAGFRALNDLHGEWADQLVLLASDAPSATRHCDARGVHRLPKPVTRARLRSVLDRARGRVASTRANAAEREAPAGLRRVLGRVVVRSAGRILALPAERIQWIEAADNYVR